MGGRSKISNWAWTGSGFIVSSILSFIKLLYTGSGFGPRFGHDLRGGSAVLFSVVFFFLGLLLLFIWAALKISGRGAGRRR
jgi:hypothetical protein